MSISQIEMDQHIKWEREQIMNENMEYEKSNLKEPTAEETQMLIEKFSTYFDQHRTKIRVYLKLQTSLYLNKVYQKVWNVDTILSKPDYIELKTDKKLVRVKELFLPAEFNHHSICLPHDLESLGKIDFFVFGSWKVDGLIANPVYIFKIEKLKRHREEYKFYYENSDGFLYDGKWYHSGISDFWLVDWTWKMVVI